MKNLENIVFSLYFTLLGRGKYFAFRAVAAFTMAIILGFGLPPAALSHEAHADVPTQSASIGGAFELTDQHGKTVKDGDFRGRVMLVFFGFTHCPDICPVSVSTLSKVMGALGDKADKVAPVFITVDPTRDTPKAMKDYLAPFDKHMVGLTGTPKQIKKAADAYKVYFAESEAGKHKAGDDYMVNHSGIIYLMGKDGAYVQHFSYDVGEKDVVAAINAYLK